MKKLFTCIAIALCSLTAMAEDYAACPLTVTVNGAAMENDPINVTVNKQSNGKYTMELKDFTLTTYFLPIGTIKVTDVDATNCGNTTVLSTEQTITIAAGSTGKPEEWTGPELGPLPILLKGEIKNGEFNAILNIPLNADMLVGVQLGKSVNNLGQLPNSGFETFHTATYDSYTSEEPNGWHTFMSASGSLASQVATITHTWASNEIRKNAETENKQCVKVASAPVKIKFGSLERIVASANGTITTGRLQAGSMTASDKANCAFLDFSLTNKDGNGDPYYAVLNNKPDAIKAWVKFKAGDGNNNPTASISALLSNGKKIQDPEDSKLEDNIIARAINTNIASTNAWQQIEIPFNYANTTTTPLGALVTISTCSVPSGGSKSETNPDIIYVDDIELVYNAEVKSITVKGVEATTANGTAYEANISGTISPEDINVQTNAQGAYVSKILNNSKNGGVDVAITVTSNDLKKANMYNLHIEGATTGINKPQTVTTQSGIKAVYNLSGQQVSGMSKAGVYIVERNDGTTVKVLKK